ncbi:amino-acid N-acetyltransferase [Coraliomargarita sp. SDUM461004]|uniref:amino-acid N-acetyltransferase n=1 Tax=Thalassobacterium sedimentorum TaxID=3041258 RepID=A0ABU1AJA9_9BACT|nr:amino-acid N-acetyltransferase [Coraliomargarita sp. SDUM461004]MDQ8194907.1 amino-acid N-acetyltransferase [Coraliomargarita sp. SDUM461004]
MNTIENNENTIKPTDLRGILKYVPMFRDHVFVLALDGSLVAHENFQNVLLDIAVLRSLNIKVVLVHGIGQQLKALAAQKKTVISDPHGEQRTDTATLELATEAAAIVSLQVMQGLTRNGLRCATCNGVRSKEIGIVKGEDQLSSGTVDKLDVVLFNKLLDADTIPVITPIAFSREGTPLRINSDLLASELASKLSASKLIYMTTEEGLKLDDQPLTNLPVADLERLLQTAAEKIPDRLQSKSRQAVRAIHAGTPRAHILDGRAFGALLNEIFDKVGIGTMVYSNDYQSIRRAVAADAHSIFNITRNAVRSESLRERSQESIEATIDKYLVYEIDGSIVGCVNLKSYDNGEVIEVGSVYVQPFYQNKGVGRKMVEFACAEAKTRGAKRVIAMTTQANKFFSKVCGFTEGGIDDLPAERREDYANNGRNSKVLHLSL